MATPRGNWCEGRHTDNLCPCRQGLDDQALIIDRHRDHDGAGSRERNAKRGIAGVLNRNDRLPGPYQDSRQEVEGLLRAGRDQDVVRLASDGAGQGDVMGDSVAQAVVTLIALRASQAGGFPLEPAQLLRADAAKDVIGKLLGVDQGGPKIRRDRFGGWVAGRRLAPEAHGRGHVD
jgi:hypothetical protein